MLYPSQTIMRPAWSDDAELVSESEVHPTRKRMLKVMLVVVALACLTYAGAHSQNSKWLGTASSSGTVRFALKKARGDAPNLVAAAAQKEIYDNEKILRTAYGQTKNIWLGVYQQYNATVHQNKDIRYKQYTSMVYAQVHFHIEATSENVHLFIEDVAYGLWISYKYKTNWLVKEDAYRKMSTEHVEKVTRLKKELREVRSRLERLVRRDATNAPIASSKLAAARSEYHQYMSLKAAATQQRQAWKNDLAARQAAQSMSFVQHLHSIHLFTVYKITKTAELVHEYAWIINYTEYLRWAFGHSFVMEGELEHLVSKIRDATELLMKQI